MSSLRIGFLRVILVSSWLFLPVQLHAETPNTSNGFFCRTEGRFLSDQDFYLAAYNHEMALGTLSEELQQIGVAGLVEANPNCCSVQRESSDLNSQRGWLERQLFDPSVGVHVNWDAGLQTPPDLDPSVFYEFSICGQVGERYRSLR